MNQYEIIGMQKENEKLRAINETISTWHINSGVRDIIYKGMVEQASSQTLSLGLQGFVKAYNQIYIYGAGRKAERIARKITDMGYDFSGFLISPTEIIVSDLMGKRVMHINDIQPTPNMGLVVALNSTNVVAAAGSIATSGFEAVYYAK